MRISPQAQAFSPQAQNFRLRHQHFRPRRTGKQRGTFSGEIFAWGTGFFASGEQANREVLFNWEFSPEAQEFSPQAQNFRLRHQHFRPGRKKQNISYFLHSSATFILCKYLQTSALFFHEMSYNSSKKTWNWSYFHVMTHVIITPNLFHSLSSRNISISKKTKHYLNPFG